MRRRVCDCAVCLTVCVPIISKSKANRGRVRPSVWVTWVGAERGVCGFVSQSKSLLSLSVSTCCNDSASAGLLTRKKQQTAIEVKRQRRTWHGSKNANAECDEEAVLYRTQASFFSCGVAQGLQP